MFDITQKIGLSKIYTDYTNDTSASRLKPTGKISFIRKDPISDEMFNSLKEELSTIGVKIFSKKQEKGPKCAVTI
jgi:hypothetical protein